MSVAIQIIPDDTLVHHGILGQKWGKLNGPPYPLGSSEHSASERKAGWRKSLDSSGNSQKTKKAKVVDKSSSNSQNENKRKGLSDKQKTAIKLGATVAVAALATYGTYKLAKSGKLDELTSLGKSKIDELLGNKSNSVNSMDFSKYDSDLNRYNMDFSKLNFAQNNTTAQRATVSQTISGIKKLAKPETFVETIKNVNPNRGNSDYNNNCTVCSIASALRQRGLDVTAGTTGGKQQILGGIVDDCFKGARVIDGTAVKFGRSRQDAAEMLVNKFGNNASGVVSVQWKTGGGHAFNWSINDGVVKFFDGQGNKDDSYISNVYWKFINPNDSLTIARLDNAEINYEAIKKYVE